MNPFFKKLIIFKLILLLLVLQFTTELIFIDFGLYAQNNQTCNENLKKADNAYFEGEFDDVLKLIKQCLSQSDISKEQRIQAYTILSRTMVAMDQMDKAKNYINKILEINPEYSPTIEQETPKYVSLVKSIREEKEKKIQKTDESGISSWLWIGAGGVVATAAIIAIAVSGNDKKDSKKNSLPEPPEFQ